MSYWLSFEHGMVTVFVPTKVFQVISYRQLRVLWSNESRTLHRSLNLYLLIFQSGTYLEQRVNKKVY